MKKLFFLSLIFFFALALAGFTPVKADSVVVNGSYTDTDTLSQADYDELQNTALLLKYLQNGGVVDVSNVSDGYSVSDLVSDFGNFVKEVVPDLIDVINPFQSKFEYTPLGNAMLNNNIYKFMGMLPFHALRSSDEPQPEPDIDYLSYINRINKRDLTDNSTFWFYNCSEYWNQVRNNAFPVINYSWVTYSNDLSTIFGSSYVTPYMYPCELMSLYIFSNNDTYSFSVNVTSFPNFVTNQYNMFWKYGYIEYINNTYTINGLGQGSYTPTPITNTFSYTGTLAQCLEYIAQHFKNVNIYVDGDLWSYVGNNTNYSLQIYNDTVSPVATNDYGYVHWVYDYEIFFRIDRIWDILQDILDNMDNGGSTIIRWPDIDDVIVDVDGQPAVAVKIYTPDSNIDEEYWSKYGPLVPVFIPLATPVINDSDILLIASTPMSALPNDLLEVFGYIFIGSLFVCFIHRLLE